MTTPLEQILDLARRHVNDQFPRNAEAEKGLDDARWLVGEELPISAASRALDSLSYSVGREHADYIEARRLFGEVVAGR